MSTKANTQWRPARQVRIALTLGLAALLWAPARASATQLLYNSTFEGDTVNPNPRVDLGTAPAVWGGTQTYTADGMADVCVVSGGSPFAGGSAQSALLYDNTTLAPRIDVAQSFAAQSSRPITVSFDVRFNNAAAGSLLLLRVMGPADNGVYFQASGSQIQAVDLRDGVLENLAVGTWYRVQMNLPAVTSRSSRYSIDITDAPTMETQTFQGVLNVGAGVTGYNRVYLTSGFGGAQLLDANLDNITVDVVPEPASLGLFGIGGVVLFFARRRKG